ncbi:MAG TPA: sulfite exporter TauE/SafE family protein [Phycisphaerae bacterium]|nr:sulfite exporter TauE/SafE family protein [Phycisphaerae bacterium]
MEYVLLAGVGVIAGLLGGLLGIGGSSVMLPAMVWILGAVKMVNGEPVEQIHQYMAAAMIVNFLLIIPSVIPHVRNKAVWMGVWKFMAPAALAGILLGVALGEQFKDGNRATYLRWAVGVFFIYVVLNNVRRLLAARKLAGLDRQAVEAMPAWRKVVVGFPMGIIAGLLGIGGGALAVPGQQVVLKVPLRNAIATSAATIATISWVGAIAKNLSLAAPYGSIPRSVLLAGCLAPTAMIGSYIGGHLTHKLPLKVVRIVFIALMCFATYKMFTKRPKPAPPASRPVATRTAPATSSAPSAPSLASPVGG